MTPLKEFQEAFGREWAEITASPAFAAGLACAQAEKIRGITILTDEEIRSNGKAILADLRGFLQYESGLLGLHEKKEFVFQSELGDPTYPDPIVEANELQSVQPPEPDESGLTPAAPPKRFPSHRKPRKKSKGKA